MRSLVIVLLLAVLVYPVSAGPSTSLVATVGVESGTYYRFFNEIARVCATPAIQGMTSKGSIENLERLLNNEAHLAFIQADVLFARRTIDNDQEVDRVRTFMTLYPEEIHVLVRSNNNYINRFSDLGNKKVGVYGGSIITSRVLFAKTGLRPLNNRFFAYAGPLEAVAALDKNEIDAILGVGGQPLPWVKSLDTRYRLVPFDLHEKVKDVYQPAVLSYSNLEQQGGVQTTAVLSMIVTINYRTPSTVQSLLQLRNCVFNNLDTLREAVGNHPKWRLVNSKNKGPWSYFDPTPSPAPKKP